MATMHLADMGADVVKIEDTGEGDYARTLGRVRDGMTEFFRLINRNKRALRLNLNWFSDLAGAREKIAQWKQDYNEKRPHSSLQYRTPVEFAAQAAGFYRNEVGQEASNAGPLPQTPIPAAQKGMWGEQKPEKVSLSLD